MGIDLSKMTGFSHVFNGSVGSVSIDLEAERKSKAEDKFVAEKIPAWETRVPTNYSDIEPVYIPTDARATVESHSADDDAHTEEISYFNHSNADMFITSSNGFNRILQGTSNYTKMRNTVIARKTFRFSNIEALMHSINEFKRYSGATGGKMSATAMILYRSLLEFYNAKSSSTGKYQGIRMSISIDLCFDTRKIPTQGIYVEDLDVVIAPNANAVHPNDRNYKSISKMSKLTEKYGCSGIFVEIVDNDSQYESKYLYSAGEVVEIVPVRDPSRENGVTMMKVSTGANGTTKIEQVRSMSVEDAVSSCFLFDTAQAAYTKGDPGKKIDLELVEASNNNRILKAVTEEKKYELDSVAMDRKMAAEMLAMERDRERSELERENASLKLRMTQLEAAAEEFKTLSKQRMMAIADEYEHRSHRRKESSELLKLAPMMTAAVIGGIGTVLAMRK